MIRYPVNRATLQNLIDAHEPGWRLEATSRTTELINAARYVEKSSIWSRVKLVFMRLQHYKCIFCERPLSRSTIEHDVEHFRPKNPVKIWPPLSARTSVSPYKFPTGEPHLTGYYWLAYEIENYAASCKDCNTIRKSNYFPIGGTRGEPTDEIRVLNNKEKPFLIYPIGDLDQDDPTDLIIFDGILALPRYRKGVKNRRARITIDFFQLNKREELWEDRFRVIREIFFAVETLQTSSNNQHRAAAQTTLNDAISDAAPQASCARSFIAVMISDPTRAWNIFNSAEKFIRSNINC